MDIEKLSYNQKYYLKNRDRILNEKAKKRGGKRGKGMSDFDYVFKKCYSVRIRHKKKKSATEMAEEYEKLMILRNKLGMSNNKDL